MEIDFHLKQKIETRLINNFSSAKISDQPYPHFYVKDIFSKDVYEMIQRLMPDDAEFHENKRKQTTQGRKHLKLDEANLIKLDKEKEIFWGTIAEALKSNKFSNRVKTFLDKHLQKRYGTANIETVTRLELLRDRAEFEIPPHTDSGYKAITIFIYLPADKNLKQYGTSIYIPKEIGFKDEESTRYPYDQFYELKRAAFLPNSLFGFMKTDNSFHGRPPLNGLKVNRNSLNCSINLPNSIDRCEA